MLLINISSDKIHISDGKQDKVLDRNGIEDTFGPILLDRHQKSPFQEIFLINGPGGFTNLRVGTLILNLLNEVTEKKLQIYSVDKLTLFSYLVSQKVLPAMGVVYLGQKNNVRLVDFSKKTAKPTMIQLAGIPADAFLDEVHDPKYWPKGNKNMVHFENNKGKIFATYQKKKHEINVSDLKIKPSIHVEAEYMIQPVLN